MGRNAKDPAQHWITATQKIIEFLGNAGETEEKVKQMLGEGLDAAIGMYYESIRQQTQPTDGQAIPADQRPAVAASETTAGH